MINRLFESISTANLTSSLSNKMFCSFSLFLTEIFSKISEVVLQMRFDRNNLKQFLTKNGPTCHFFQLSLKKIYKTKELILSEMDHNSKNCVFIEFFLQNKTNSNRHLIERWTLWTDVSTEHKDSFFMSEKIIGKVSIFVRSLLCMLCTTPIWKLYLTKTSQSQNFIKKTILDYNIFFEAKNKSGFDQISQKIIKKNINLEISPEFSINLNLEYLQDFNTMMEAQNSKMGIEEKGFKRLRFLSEGFPYNLESNMKSDISTNDSNANNTSGILRCDSDNFCNNEKEKQEKHQNKAKRETDRKHKNLMSRKDSLILLSNNPEKNKNMKVLDDEGEEIEIEYVDERKLNNNFFMQIIKEQEKEDIDMLIKEKMLKTDLFEQDDDYYVLKFNPEPKKNNYIEKILMKINEMKNQKIRKVEKMKNLKEEMNEIKKFYFSLIKEEKSDN